MKEKGRESLMKKKLYLLSMVTILSLTCIGCGRKDAATDRKMAEATTEITTETTEKVTEQADKKTEKTTEATTEKVSEDKKSEKSDKKKSDSKSDKSKAANTVAQSDKAVTQPANESKPVVTTNSNSSTSSNTSANNTPQATEKPQTTECQHDWVAVTHTVHHDAVMGERIVESAVYAHWYCNDCQKYYISVWDDPCGAANGSDASYCLKPAVRETYEVTPAYDETVTDYYKCSKCGIRK